MVCYKAVCVDSLCADSGALLPAQLGASLLPAESVGAGKAPTQQLAPFQGPLCWVQQSSTRPSALRVPRGQLSQRCGSQSPGTAGFGAFAELLKQHRDCLRL